MEDWIIVRPDLLGGKPCIKGTRISVEFLLELLASGATPREILASYPRITAQGFAAAMQYAARGMKNDVIWDIQLSA